MSYAVRAWRDAKGESGITIGTVTPGGYDNYVAEITLLAGEIPAFMDECAAAARRGAAAAGLLSEPMPGPYGRWEDDREGTP